MMDRPLLLKEFLWRAERVFPEKEIIVRRGSGDYHRETYADYGRQVRRLAKALLKLGVEPGDRVGTLGWNTQRHLHAYMAIPGIGAICHTVNRLLFAEQQRFIINHAADRFLILDTDQVERMEELSDSLSTVEAYIVMGDGEIPDTSLSPVYNYDELLADHDDDFEFPEFDERTAAAMCYTSATTGDPKGVVYSHRGMVLQALCLAQHGMVGMSEEQIWLAIAPMFHCNAWNIPHTAIMQGSTLVLPGIAPQARDYVETMEELGVTGVNAGVTLGTMMRDVILGFDREVDLSSLDRMWLGGQAPSQAIVDWWKERYGCEVVQRYGMTENSPQITFFSLKSSVAARSPEEVRAIRTKQGLPLPLMELKVVNDEGHEQPWDGKSVGEFLVRSPWTASAYYDDERTKDAFADGWLRTGDVGVIDTDGYVTLMDRTKDLIKSGGEWISSVDLENALMSYPKIREAAVIAVPHEKWVERPLACVVPVDEQELAKELKSHLSKTFAKWSLPDDYIVIDEVPKTGVGKYDKKVLRARVEKGGVEALRAAVS